MVVRGSDFAEGEADINIHGMGSDHVKIENTIAQQLAFVDATFDVQGQTGKAHLSDIPAVNFCSTGIPRIGSVSTPAIGSNTLSITKVK